MGGGGGAASTGRVRTIQTSKGRTVREEMRGSNAGGKEWKLRHLTSGGSFRGLGIRGDSCSV